MHRPGEQHDLARRSLQLRCNRSVRLRHLDRYALARGAIYFHRRLGTVWIVEVQEARLRAGAQGALVDRVCLVAFELDWATVAVRRNDTARRSTLAAGGRVIILHAGDQVLRRSYVGRIFVTGRSQAATAASTAAKPLSLRKVRRSIRGVHDTRVLLTAVQSVEVLLGLGLGVELLVPARDVLGRLCGTARVVDQYNGRSAEAFGASCSWS
jgi:hypothetical protein